MHHAVDLGQMPVHVGVGGGVRGRRVVALDQMAVQVADHHVVGGQLVVEHPGRLDHEQVRAADPGRHVARGPGHQAVAGQLGVQVGHLAPDQPHQVLGLDRDGHAGSSSRTAASTSSPPARRTGRRTPPPQLPQPVHHRVAAAAEVVVHSSVLGVELVVDGGVGRVRGVGARLRAPHHLRRRGDVGVGAGGHGGVDRRAQRRRLVGGGQGERQVEHVGVDLHHQPVLQQPTGDDELGDRDAGGVEGLHDRPGAERGGLDQGPVDVLRAGGQGLADDHPGQVVVDQHRAVAAVPVQRDQPVLADRLARRQVGQQLVHADPAALGLGRVRRGDLLVDEPAEDVADPALPGLVAPAARGDAAVHHAAHARHLGQPVAVHHVAGRGAHDRQQLARVDRPSGRAGDVGVDVAGGDRDALGQAGPGRGLARTARRPGRRAR